MVIRRADNHSVNLTLHFIEHLAVVVVLGRVGILLERNGCGRLPRTLPPHVGVAQSRYVHARDSLGIHGKQVV